MNRSRLGSFLLLIATGLASCTDPAVVPATPAAPPPSAPAPPPPPPPPPPTGTVTSMPLETFFELQQSGKVLVYDVRPGFTRALGSIPGSISWPKNSYPSQLPTREPEIRAAIAAGKTIVLYCTDLACPDATIIATRLATLGHNTSVLEGGWDTWKSAGLPTQ